MGRAVMIRPEEGGQLGRYRILRRLGAGAMGEVYLAEDPQIGRRLAIKTVLLEERRPQEVEERKKRLLREARAAGKLLHPNIVTLFDAGEDRDTLFLAFEWVDGTDVAKRVEQGPPLTLAEALAIVRQTAEGLDYAHRQGVVHRDIKPSNVMLTVDGRVKVADFGIAKVLDSTSDLTMSGSVVGSPHYLSPEQIRGDELDGRTDIFSLGVLLYEILCHRRPFEGETLTTLVYQILNQEPTPVDVRRPDLGPRLERLVRRMLHKDREQRFATAAEVAAEIAACERELAPELLAARAVPDAPTEATMLLPEEGLPEKTGATATAATRQRAAEPPLPATAPRATPPPPPPPPSSPPPTSPQPLAAVPPPPAPAAAPRGSGRILLFGAGVLVVAGGLLAVGWGARRWSGGRAAPDATTAEAEPTSAAVARPEPTAPAAPRRAAEPPEPAAEPARASDGGEAPAEEPPFHPGERPVVRRDAEPAPRVEARPPAAEPSPAREPVRASEPPAPVTPAPRESRPSEPAPTPTAPEPAPPSAPAESAPSEAAPDPRAARDAFIASMPVNREMTTGMSLSFELPKGMAERTVVRFDRIVIGRAAEWNASKRGGRAYSVPEPGLHLLTFLVDGSEVFRIRIDAREGTPGPTVVAPEVPGGDGGRPRRRGAG